MPSGLAIPNYSAPPALGFFYYALPGAMPLAITLRTFSALEPET
jgi:hypothetical protein